MCVGIDGGEMSKDECVRGLVSRGYDGIVIGFEYLRCSEIRYFKIDFINKRAGNKS